ncbi:hypothetical protein [Phenylobacterium deserti]|uniref:hypothetical protein n=1 Tax=Phenylobacterium deserti TaxID=1914756 RepID=UPI001402BF51|nr:hypothetical protein [Phenylobacterium deserti]
MNQPTRTIRAELIARQPRVRRPTAVADRIPPGVSLTLALFVSGLMWLAIALGVRALFA